MTDAPSSVSSGATPAVPGAITIPWADPYIDDREVTEVLAAFRSGWLTMGPRVRALEEAWAGHLGARHAIAVANGSVALELALGVLGVGPGDEVIVPAVTYVATVNAVILRGAVPICADIDDETFGLDPDDVERRVTGRTKAVIYIDYGGIPARHAALDAVARRHGLLLLQDAAHSLGGWTHGRALGFQASMSTVSFHAAKQFSTIEGGMIFTDNDAHADELRILRNQGEDPDQKYRHVRLGCNARMTDLHAAVGLAQFRKYEEIATRRRELALTYDRLLAGYDRIVRVGEQPGTRNGWHLYPVRVPHRDAVATRLRARGIDTRVVYPVPVYRQPFFRERYPTAPRCPFSEDFTSAILCLPLYHGLAAHQQQVVVESLASASAGGG